MSLFRGRIALAGAAGRGAGLCWALVWLRAVLRCAPGTGAGDPAYQLS